MSGEQKSAVVITFINSNNTEYWSCKPYIHMLPVVGELNLQTITQRSLLFFKVTFLPCSNKFAQIYFFHIETDSEFHGTIYIEGVRIFFHCLPHQFAWVSIQSARYNTLGSWPFFTMHVIRIMVHLEITLPFLRLLL